MKASAKPVTLVTVAFGSVGAAYGGTNLIVRGTNDVRVCTKISMRNDTDAAVLISWDGGEHDHFYLDPGEQEIYDQIMADNVQVKRNSGAPTAGSVKFTFFLE